MPTSYFCAFEGGGAKGLAHLSTLSGLETLAERHGLAPRAYAGTSAGAIVAALAAAGWSSQELLDRRGRVPHSRALAQVGLQEVRSLFALFDPVARRRLRLLAWAAGVVSHRWTRFALISAALVAMVAGLLTWPWATLALLALAGLAMWLLLFRFRGLASLDAIASLIEQLLQAKLGAPGEALTFARMRHLTGIDLAVIAARLEDAKLVRFDADETPDVPVARAVTASAAIPIVFEPVEIDGAHYCDGGIVSNLPAWVFDSSLITDPHGLVVTSEIAGPPQRAASHADKGLRMVGRVLRAGLFGARVLETRGLRNHLSLKLDTGEIRTLDFAGTASHLPLLRRLDPVIHGRIEAHLLAMEEAALRHELYAEALEPLLGPQAARICVILLRPERTLSGKRRGFQPWHASGPRDCRWHPFLDTIAEAVDRRAVTFARARLPGDVDWCVVLPADTAITAAIVCMGDGVPERLPEIAGLIARAETGINNGWQSQS